MLQLPLVTVHLAGGVVGAGVVGGGVVVVVGGASGQILKPLSVTDPSLVQETRPFAVNELGR